jgi:indolepyruvate ferredoxin oxidoreductase beta subunit
MTSTCMQQDTSGWRILIAGTGGQGVLTVARLLCGYLVDQGHNVVSGQLHGMAQRGGSVQSSVMVDCGISPVIGQGRADFVLGFEPVETARALPFMSSSTAVYKNTAPVIPYVLGQRSALKQQGSAYPEVSGLYDAISRVASCVCSFDATRLAIEAGSPQSLNMVMLGCLLGCLLGCGTLPYAPNDFWNAVSKRLPPTLAETNTKAFASGVEASRRFQPAESVS